MHSLTSPPAAVYLLMRLRFLQRVTYQPTCSMQDPTGEAAAEAQKHLTLYELDLGLNHVMRKWSQPIDNGANLLIPVPGGGDGPGGVIVCAENFLIYKNQVRQYVGGCLMGERMVMFLLRQGPASPCKRAQTALPEGYPN